MLRNSERVQEEPVSSGRFLRFEKFPYPCSECCLEITRADPPATHARLRLRPTPAPA